MVCARTASAPLLAAALVAALAVACSLVSGAYAAAEQEAAGAGGEGLGLPLWSDEDGEEDDITAIDDPRRDYDGTSVWGDWSRRG